MRYPTRPAEERNRLASGDRIRRAPAGVVQVGDKDIADLMELLDGYKTMLLSHEKRIGFIEELLANAIQPPPNRRERRKIR